jgi:hypothetical protein
MVKTATDITTTHHLIAESHCFIFELNRDRYNRWVDFYYEYSAFKKGKLRATMGRKKNRSLICISVIFSRKQIAVVMPGGHLFAGLTEMKTEEK